MINELFGHLKLRVYPNICPETKVLSCMFLGKTIFPNNDGMMKFLYALNQYQLHVKCGCGIILGPWPRMMDEWTD